MDSPTKVRAAGDASSAEVASLVQRLGAAESELDAAKSALAASAEALSEVWTAQHGCAGEDVHMCLCLWLAVLWDGD